LPRAGGGRARRRRLGGAGNGRAGAGVDGAGAMSVALVGAGPGDPELITLRGLARVRAAEVLVYDRLVAGELVAEAPIGCVRIPRDGLSQDDINALLVAHGRRGRRVVRLKGGDPFVFGRGGEEALALVRAGIPFELGPGVSSIAAVPEAAAIPVTHRGVSQMVTAFAANDVEQLDVRALAQVPGTLAAIGAAARNAPTPALVVVGDVVALRDALAGATPAHALAV